VGGLWKNILSLTPCLKAVIFKDYIVMCVFHAFIIARIVQLSFPFSFSFHPLKNELAHDDLI
jgi:hypothetical protein